MQKPNNFDETQAAGEFTPVELGGHKMFIRSVEEKTSSTGKPMIKIEFDFDRGDVQEGYFTKMNKDDIRPDKKWPFQATQRVVTEDNDGKCSRGFKSFITCVENSNPGFKVTWGDNFGAQFRCKKIAGVFGEQMDYYNGEVKKKRVLRWFTSVDKYQDASVPEISETANYKNRPTGAPVNSDTGFMNLPDGLDEALPFN